MKAKMLLISQHTSVPIILIWMTICCTQSHASVSFYRVDIYVLSRFQGAEIVKLPSEILQYGPKFPDPPEGFDGMIVLANPADGCQAIAPPPNATNNINPIGKWIAFMKIGNCDVTVKTRNAQNANYHMALIDDETDDWMFSGKTQYDKNANTSDIKINTVVAPRIVTDHVKKYGTYDKRRLMNVMNDDADPIDCRTVIVEGTENTFRNRTIECRKIQTWEIVPTPATWMV